MRQLPKSIFKCFLVSKTLDQSIMLTITKITISTPSTSWGPQPSRQATLTIPSSAPPSPPRLATTGEPCRREEKEQGRGKGGKLLFINENLCLAFQKSGWALSVADRGEPERQGGQYFVWGGLTSLQIMWHLVEYHLNTRFFFLKDYHQQEIQHAAGVLDVNAFEWKVLNEVLIFSV